MASAAAGVGDFVDTGNHQHRDGIGFGLRHGRGDVGHARAGDDEAHAHFARGAGIAIGHKACALFVAWGDVADGCIGQPTV